MSGQENLDPLHTIATALEIAASTLPEGPYLHACNAMKEIAPLAKLYTVTFYAFTAVLGEHGPVSSCEKYTRILQRSSPCRCWSVKLV